MTERQGWTLLVAAALSIAAALLYFLTPSDIYKTTEVEPPWPFLRKKRFRAECNAKGIKA